MPDGDFTKQTVEIIAKRAANECSNLDCGAVTCGPAESHDRSVTIGEAAHIYGARPGSARFSESLTVNERGDITNAIWLCRNCHKIIDADPIRFPAAILFEWRRQHEEAVAKKLGKPSEAIRQKIIAQQLTEFAGTSYLAQQIVIDKPSFWEYKLTAELLRTGLAPIVARWHGLERGLYTKEPAIITSSEVMNLLRARIDEIQKQVGAFSGLLNGELQGTWGPTGTPGNESEILRVCNLLIECAARIVQWEERVRFAILPSEFDEVQTLLSGCAGRMIEQLSKIPSEFKAIFDQENPTGTYHISLVVDLPEGWAEKYQDALRRAVHIAFG